MMIEVTDELLEEWMCEKLKEVYDEYSDEQRNTSVVCYSHNKDYELEYVYEFRKALRLVHNHYCLPSNRIEEPSYD